jgi:hypothetical protein
MKVPALLQPKALLITCTFLFLSCTHKKPVVEKAYYFWRSDEPTHDEKKFISDMHLSKLYVRGFDVDWDEALGPVPVGKASLQGTYRTLRFYDKIPVQVVPVIFITNKTFERLDTAEIARLAKRVVRKAVPLYGAELREHAYYDRDYLLMPSEIQFDCDWTTTTASRYFRFLEEVKKLLPDSVRLSATIRLHQYKYPGKTGVPPVHRGMLMIYNTGSVKDPRTKNSIFTMAGAEAYFTGDKKYPLPLDMALPAWSWSIVYRNDQFLQIANGVTPEEIDAATFAQKIKGSAYLVMKDTSFHDMYLRRGDLLRTESVTAEQLQQAAQLAKKAVNTDRFTVSLFELSESEIKNYSHAQLDQVYHSMQ